MTIGKQLTGMPGVYLVDADGMPGIGRGGVNSQSPRGFGVCV
jgi:hypothetical protein